MASGANFKLGISASTNGVEEKLADVTKSAKQMGEAAQKSARDVQDQAAAFAEEVATSGNYKRELRSAMMEVQNLTVALRNMSDEERSSSVGQALAQRLQEAKNRAAELTDTITDLRPEVKNMASDSASFDAFKQGVGLVRDGMMAMIAVTGLAGEDEKKFQKTVEAITKTFTVFNAIIGITNALQKQSALMTGIRNIQTWALNRAKAAETATTAAANAATAQNTAAEAANAVASAADAAAKTGATAATVKLTIAQRAFNAAAKSNPYVILAMAILAVGTALYSFVSSANDATEAQKKLNEEQEKAKEALEQHKKKIQDITSAQMQAKTKFAGLVAQWKELKSTAEKTEWLRENKSLMSQLGIEVNSVTTADRVFCQVNDQVIAALMARAIAAKKAQQALEEMDRLAARRGEEDKKFEPGANYSNTGSHYRRWNGRTAITDDEARAAGIRTKAERKRTDNSITAMYQAQYTGGSRTYYDTYTEEEIKKVNEYRQKMARAQAAAYKAQEDQQVKAITERYKAAVTEEMKQQQKLWNLSEHPKTSGGGSTSRQERKEAPVKGSLEDLENQRKKLVDIQHSGTFKKHKTNADDVAAEIAKLDQQIENQKFILDFNTDPAKVDLDVLERQYNKMYADLRNKKLEGPDLQKAEQNLKRLNQYIVDRKYSMGLDIKPAEDSLIQLQRKSDEIFSKMRSPEITGTADFTSLKEQYDDLQKQISGKKAELQIDTKAAEGSVSDLQQKIVALLGQQNDLKLNLDTDDAKQKVQELDGQIEELYKQMGAQAAPLTFSTEAAHQSLQAMQAKLSAMQNAVSVDVTLDDDALVKMVKEINNLQKEIKNRKITLGLETDPSIKELETLGKRAQEAMQPRKQSSFQKAVGPKPVAKNDYDAQLSELQKVMDELDNQISKLEDVKKAYEELGETSSESYQKVIDKIKELSAAQDENASKAKDINK